MKVVQVFRKTDSGFFSIERVFGAVNNELCKAVEIEKFELRSKKIVSIATFQDLIRLRKLNADVYHVTGDIHFAILALPFKRTILTIHDCVFLKIKGFKGFVMKKLWLDWPVRIAKSVTTISEKSKLEILANVNANSEKIIVIPNPVSVKRCAGHSIFNKEKPVILFIGTKPNKNLETSIKALTGLNCTLIIVGNLSNQQKELLNSSKISHVSYSNISDEDIAALYCKSDIILFPSLYEGFGMPIIEAQQSGKPVITSAISPLQETAGAGALFIDPYSIQSIRSGVELLINSSEMREKIVLSGFENVQQYSKSTIANLYLQVYRNAANG